MEYHRVFPPWKQDRLGKIQHGFAPGFNLIMTMREFYVNVEWYLQKDRSWERGVKPGFLYAKCVKEQELPTNYNHSPTVIATNLNSILWLRESDKRHVENVPFFTYMILTEPWYSQNADLSFFILSKLHLSSTSWTITDKSNIALVVPYKSKRIKSVISKWFGLFSFVFIYYHLY